MNKLKIFVGIALLCGAGSVYAQKKTTLSTEVYGYQQDMVYYDCLQSPAITAEFHNNPGEEFTYSFKPRFSPLVILVNGRTEVLMSEGDSVHVVVRKEGKQIQLVFSGSESAVAANRLRQELRQMHRQLNFKSQLLSCAALDIKPQKRINDARTLLGKVKELAAKYKDIANPQLVAYIEAEQEAMSYLSFVEYPKMYAEVRHQTIEEQEIGDYWKLMDGVKLRDDAASLMCPDYVSFLMRYCFYDQEKKAVAVGGAYTMPGTLETMFETLKQYYQGHQRDAVLYTLLCNFIRNGKQIDRVLPLMKEYKDQYNQNKAYVEVLDSLLQ
ncbi:hypothetical protein [Prevotella sp. KH2C16]|uniref:hypothetical protein n=1 Tax=Prevotella sp. KH2C16 TaxID=1855325 RepID=UPI0008EF8120|nr:hypothetical protein [Prevotella sp. KH2C16]SFG60973.1 hypothetical protein SAMN05216383_12237 [Prevotella sp. KH2C16]